MKKLYIALIIILTLTSGPATLAQSNIPATGGNAEGSGGTLSYTVGQVFYQFNTDGNGSAAQGVQQPYEISVITAIEEVDAILPEIIVYPNPADDILKLKIGHYETDNISFKLYNTNGILLETRQIEGNETDIVMRNQAPGIYILKVTNNQQELWTFKIIKK